MLTAAASTRNATNTPAIRKNARYFEELRRIIREEEPPKPSTRISTLGQAANTVSTQRRSDPSKLRQMVRGELDWIVMKAMEKDRGRRYQTANGLAMDMQRYLHDEPVLACPPGGAGAFGDRVVDRGHSFDSRALGFLAIDQAQVGLMDQGRGIQRLPRLLTG
jgi:hypothetical protein